MLRLAQFRSNDRLQRASENSPPLRQGETGEAVVRVQLALIDLGFPMPISTKQGKSLPDGIFGRETAAVVRSFQSSQSLVADAVVGRFTLAKLEEALRQFLFAQDRRLAAADPMVPKTRGAG